MDDLNRLAVITRGIRLRPVARAMGAALLSMLMGSALHAQGVATGIIRGTVTASDGTDVDGARVTVTNSVTGFVVESDVRRGRFFVPGLEVGGPYTIRVRRLGFPSQERQGVLLTLGEPIELRFVFSPSATTLDTLQVVAAPLSGIEANGGTGTTLSDSLLRRLPTLNRDLYDFVRLVPLITTKVGFRWGFSGGGGGIRSNNFLINGVPERNLVNATAALVGGKSIPLDAVREYEVLVAPYDVRYGDFTGAVVNAVTRSGTNRLTGSMFGYLRNDQLARRDAQDTTPSYDRLQYGLSLGGPIMRDRLHFHLAAELQRLTSMAAGPRLGQPASARDSMPVAAADLQRISDILRGFGLEAGSGGAVENNNPLANLFGRFDLSFPRWNSRAILWTHFDRNVQDLFSRTESDTLFPLSTMQAAQRRHSRVATLQLHTTLTRAGGGHNEVLISHRSGHFDWLTPVEQPIVTVMIPNMTGGVTSVSTGTFNQAHGSPSTRFWNVNIADNITLPLGSAHVLSIGAAAELFGNTPRGNGAGSHGSWTFSSLDSLSQGVANRYEIRRAFGRVPLRGKQFAAYVSDHWQFGPSLALTMGVRADLLSVGPRAPYNPTVDSLFGRRTDHLPNRRLHLSPRIGFTWDVSEPGRDRVRGGIGIFTGRAPPWWLYTALSSYGVGVGVLRCGPTASDRGPAPPFEPDWRQAPAACASGPGLTVAPLGDVDLLARDLRQSQALRGSLAYDRRMPWDVLATGEILVTRNISDFEFVNLNLAGPQGVDRHGRVLYGSIATSGIATPERRSSFSEVIDLRNTSRNHAWQLSARLEKRFSDGLSAVASYTHSRVRDVQTPLRTAVPGIVNWSSRAVSGRHDDPHAGISLNDVPHRLVLAGTLRAPWRRSPTELAFYYVGESGGPFTWVAHGGATRRGDLNADGSNVNDPVYIPRSAFDTTEIRFTGIVAGADNSAEAQAARVRNQQDSFERLIQRTSCLRRQRGNLMKRNSCREPWTHTTVALVRQPLRLGRHSVEGELQLFNLLNLLHNEWGQYRVARPRLLEHVANTAGTSISAQSIFRFDATTARWTTLESESRFQLQFALRYRF